MRRLKDVVDHNQPIMRPEDEPEELEDPYQPTQTDQSEEGSAMPENKLTTADVEAEYDPYDQIEQEDRVGTIEISGIQEPKTPKVFTHFFIEILT